MNFRNTKTKTYGTRFNVHGTRRRPLDTAYDGPRSGVSTIILTGIATHVGVESTARDAFERGYQLVFVEDATSSPSAEAHAHSFKMIFSRIGRIRDTGATLGMLGRRCPRAHPERGRRAPLIEPVERETTSERHPHGHDALPIA